MGGGDAETWSPRRHPEQLPSWIAGTRLNRPMKAVGSRSATDHAHPILGGMAAVSGPLMNLSWMVAKI